MNASELTSDDAAGVIDEEGNIFSACALTDWHQRLSFFTSEATEGLSPWQLKDGEACAKSIIELYLQKVTF